MHLGRMLGLAGAIGATAIAIGSAGAQAGATARKFDLSTVTGVKSYLRSMGVNPAHFKFQRGLRNYAGPNCPGRGWHCTRATRVIQLAQGGGSNAYECTPSNVGGFSAAEYDETPTLSCETFQVSENGTNKARCIERAESSELAEFCLIDQTNVTGSNVALVDQLIKSRGGPEQTGSQDASVTQRNGSGKNDTTVDQRIDQSHETTTSLALTASSEDEPTQDQFSRQDSDVDQTAATGPNSSDVDQDVDQKAVAKGGGDATQIQNNDIRGHVDQDSAGLSTSKNHQHEHQIELGGTSQTQIGPLGCCTEQSGNPKNRFEIHQNAIQHASLGGVAFQTDVLVARCSTSGNCHAVQHANENGATENNSASGPDIAIGIACASAAAVYEGEGGCFSFDPDEG